MCLSGNCSTCQHERAEQRDKEQAEAMERGQTAITEIASLLTQARRMLDANARTLRFGSRFSGDLDVMISALKGQV